MSFFKYLGVYLSFPKQQGYFWDFAKLEGYFCPFPLKQISDNELEIIEGTPEIAPIPNLNVSETETIKLALEATIAKVTPKHQSYIPQLRELCMEHIDIFGVDHGNLKQTNVIEFDIDTGDDAASIYIKPRPLPYKYK